MSPPARSSRPVPLADLLDRCLDKALAAQGFAASDILLAWEDIVGPRLAQYARPLRINWPRQPRHGDAPKTPATLEVLASSAFALELQHTAPVIIERINAHFGWRCIGKILIRQGSPPRPAPPPPAPAIDPRAQQQAESLTARVEDERLRGALTRLGAAVLSQPGPG